MRRNRPALWATFGLALVLTSGCETPAAPAASDVASVQPLPALAERAATGRLDTYAFSWTSRSLARSQGLLAEDLDVGGGIRLEGTLEARGYGRNEDGYLVGLRIATLDEATLDVLGHNVLENDNALLGVEALAVVGDDGAIERLEVPATATPLTGRLLAAIATRVDLHVPGPHSRPSASIPVTQGIASASYGRHGNVVEREIEALTRLDAEPEAGTPRVRGDARIEYDDAGLVRIEAQDALLVVRDHEAVLEANSAFSLRRVGSVPLGDDAAPSDEERVDIDPLAPPDEREAARLMAERFAAGITDFDISIGIRSAGNGLPPERGFMARAVGRLRAFPQSAMSLGEVFDTETRMAGRTLALDLLASAGTPEAQAVMTERLGRADVQRDPGFPRWVQNFSFVEHPEPASALFLLELEATPSEARHPDAAPALLYPMGAMARRLARTDPVLARALADRVRSVLAGSEERTVTTAALAGLGNAGRAGDFGAIVPHTLSHDPQIRATAAAALRWSAAPQAPGRILTMLGDTDPYVANAALDAALATETHDAADAVAIAALGGRLNLAVATSAAVHLSRRQVDPSLLRLALEGLSNAVPAGQQRDLQRILDDLDQRPGPES